MRTPEHNTISGIIQIKESNLDSGTEEYGRKLHSSSFHVIPNITRNYPTYSSRSWKRMFENERYAFISGHTETYKVVMILKKD
jgi:hypothetical protein